jgi:hypothetical protein
MIILAVAVNAMRLLLYEHIYLNGLIQQSVKRFLPEARRNPCCLPCFEKAACEFIPPPHPDASTGGREEIKNLASGLSLDGRVKHPQG